MLWRHGRGRGNSDIGSHTSQLRNGLHPFKSLSQLVLQRRLAGDSDPRRAFASKAQCLRWTRRHNPRQWNYVCVSSRENIQCLPRCCENLQSHLCICCRRDCTFIMIVMIISAGEMTSNMKGLGNSWAVCSRCERPRRNRWSRCKFQR